MKTVILAAGQGKRLKPLTATRPKVMLPLANTPILEHILLNAKSAGVKDFIFVVSYHKEVITDYFKGGEKWNVNIEYITQSKPLGTAHAIGSIRDRITDKFIVLSGDTIVSSGDLRKLFKADKITLGGKEVENPWEYGAVELENDKILKIHEKVKQPPTNLVNTGIYCFNETIFKAIDETKKSRRLEYEITDSIDWLIKNGEKLKARHIKECIDVGRPWDILSANAFLLDKITKNKINGMVESGATIHGNVIIGKGTRVMNGAYIEGPVVIGNNCKIGPNAHIRPSTSIGNNCHVGGTTEIKNSVIMDKSNVPHQNYVGDSVIGQNCNLGAGTKIADLRLDKKNIVVSFQGEKIDTGLRKLGAIIGDNVQTGINASINTGTIIGNNTFIGPGAIIQGEIAPNSKIM